MLSMQFLRFLIVGVLNTAAGYAAILALRYGLAWHDMAANAGGYAIGACLSYGLHRRFTFDSQRAHGPAVAWFVVALALSYGINAVVLLVALHGLQLPSFVAQACAMAAYSMAFFLLSRSLVFKSASGAP